MKQLDLFLCGQCSGLLVAGWVQCRSQTVQVGVSGETQERTEMPDNLELKGRDFLYSQGWFVKCLGE